MKHYISFNGPILDMDRNLAEVKVNGKTVATFNEEDINTAKQIKSSVQDIDLEADPTQALSMVHFAFNSVGCKA